SLIENCIECYTNLLPFKAHQLPSDMLDFSKDINLDLYQSQYPSNHSSESNRLDEDFPLLPSEIQCEGYSYNELYENLFESSDSSSENETLDCNIDSQHKYSFYIKVNDSFNTFEQIERKLDRYAMERGFVVRK
ncbi:8377_t:CDS:2, partial [Racocetra fulgida]